MNEIRLAAVGAAIAALIFAGCGGGGDGIQYRTGGAGAVGAVDVAGQLILFADGECATALPASASTVQAQGSTLLALRFDGPSGEGTSSLAATLNIEPPLLLTNGAAPPPGAELLIPLIMREATLTLRIDGHDVAFDQPSRNGYVSPDLRSGYISGTTTDGQRVAINFLCPRPDQASDESLAP